MATQRARPSPAYPVHTLREQATALEAAIALVLAKPRKKPVHQLRTSTRRIEAQLELLCLLESSTPALKGFSNSTRKLRKLLSAVRKAASKVRDLDVQRDLIQQAADKRAKKKIRADAKHLRTTLKTDRAHEAEALLAELEGHAAKLSPKLEKTLAKLEDASDLAVSPTQLTKLIRSWYEARTTGGDSSETSLHGTRKSAKLARYMAESGDVSALAEDFEATQQLGGAWHDALTLRQTARGHLGKKAELTHLFTDHERSALEQYRKRLGLGDGSRA